MSSQGAVLEEPEDEEADGEFTGIMGIDVVQRRNESAGTLGVASSRASARVVLRPSVVAERRRDDPMQSSPSSETAGANGRPNTSDVTASTNDGSTAAAGSAPPRTNGSTHESVGDEDEVRSFLRGVDAKVERQRAHSLHRAGNSTSVVKEEVASSSSSSSTSSQSTRGSHRMWRVIPGGVRDVVESLPEGGSRTWHAEGTLRPRFEASEFVSDSSGLLGFRARRELNGNLTSLTRVSPCRLAVFIANELPREPLARRAYGVNLMRAWLKMSRAYELTSLLLVSPAVAEVVVSPRCGGILRDSSARQLSAKATEILRLPPHESSETAGPKAQGADVQGAGVHVNATSAAPEHQASKEYGWQDPRYSRLEESALKASFYISFILRSQGVPHLALPRTPRTHPCLAMRCWSHQVSICHGRVQLIPKCHRAHA